MEFTEKDLEHIERLARVRLDGESRERLREQLSRIIEFVRRLEAIDTTGSGDLQRDRGLSSPLREDERRPCIAREEILGAAPERRGAFFGVPSVIEAGDS